MPPTRRYEDLAIIRDCDMGITKLSPRNLASKHGYRLRDFDSDGAYWVIHIQIRTIKKVSESNQHRRGRLRMSTEATIYSQQSVERTDAHDKKDLAAGRLDMREKLRMINDQSHIDERKSGPPAHPLTILTISTCQTYRVISRTKDGKKK